MKRSGLRTLNSIVIAGILLLASIALAADEVGSVVALKGAALIQRNAKSIEAKLKDGLLIQDTVETKESAKAKLLFIDDSVLTLAEKSKVIIREFIYSKDARGRSIFNLIDGKMRSVVGKSDFEIHTPTVVAAARGTVFECEVGKSGGRVFTTCTCFEGMVDIRSTDPTISGSVTLRPGMTVTVPIGQPLPAPTWAPAAPSAGLQPSGMAAAEAVTESLRSIQTPPITQQVPVVPPPQPTGSIQVGW
jgi:hypothetical protein